MSAWLLMNPPQPTTSTSPAWAFWKSLINKIRNTPEKNLILFFDYVPRVTRAALRFEYGLQYARIYIYHSAHDSIPKYTFQV